MEIHGNFCWGSATSKYGTALKKTSEKDKLKHVKEAVDILNQESLSPIKKAKQIMRLPGFGRNTATGLAMLFHPNELAIYNKASTQSMISLGRETGTLESFQKEASRLKSLLGADDYLELDWFLYRFNQGDFPQLSPDITNPLPKDDPRKDPVDYWQSIESDLLGRRNSLLERSMLLTADQLEHQLAAFKARFAPDVLRGLNGPELLERMHGGKKSDGLTYWLEFKNDEDFSTTDFGSIAGGGAHKFGIFRRKEDGLWYSGIPQKQYQVTEDEAIEIAIEQRDQLLAGNALLNDLPAGANNAKYQKLQETIQDAMPDLAHLGWAHKYLCLLHLDKLDDFHNQAHQRFHLIKLLRQPPAENGLYVAGYEFATLSRKLDISLNQLTNCINDRDGSPYTYWRIGTTAGDAGADLFAEMLKGEHVSIGYEKIGDFIKLSLDSWQILKDQVQQKYPDKTAAVCTNQAKQAYRFAHKIAEGDLVLACEGAKVKSIGVVTGGYRYNENLRFPHLRPVEWYYTKEWKLPEKEGLHTTVYQLKKAANLLEAERLLLSKKGSINVSNVSPRLTGIPARIKGVLERKGQVILFGPPGTGKTYWALQTVKELAAHSHHGKGYKSLTPDQQQALMGHDNTPGLVRVCTFHPSYGYEDFIEGYRPQIDKEGMTFVRKEGIFREMCIQAEKNPNKNFYLVVDEINRGDIPRIFGELITLLEMDKRGRQLILPLSGEPFSVPSNVFVVGTMNTADRSIALLDTALRRRFGFVELMPDYSVLEGSILEGVPLAAWLEALNEKIVAHVGSDARNLQIGHAYLLDQERPLNDFQQFARVVRDDIIPLLQEYCYDDYASLQSILGSDLVDAARQKIREEFFAKGAREKLVRVLLAIDPEMTATVEAGRAEDLESAREAEDEEQEEDDNFDAEP